MEDKNIVRKLLKKYLNATASSQEIEQVENWYNSYEGRSEIDPENKEIIGRDMRLRLRNQMRKTATSRSLRFYNNTFLRIAASILVICSLGCWLYVAEHKTIANIPPLLTYSTKAGEKKTFQLSDGSEIILSPLSKLAYPKHFKKTSREVSLLEGEAFFKIAHDEKRPFYVGLADKIFTKVLGTSFQIRAFKASGELNIAVATGKVAVGNKQQLFGTLTRGQQITYNRGRQSAIISQVRAADSQIVFEGIDLQQAMHQLEYLYSIKINIDPSIPPNLGCTVTFSSMQNPEEIIDLLCNLHNLQFKTSIDHKSFNISKK